MSGLVVQSNVLAGLWHVNVLAEPWVSTFAYRSVHVGRKLYAVPLGLGYVHVGRKLYVLRVGYS